MVTQAHGLYAFNRDWWDRKLEDWDEEDSFGFGNASTVPGKNSRVVVLKHMFTLKELEEDASLLLDLKEDVRDECSTLGEVTNVTLYDVRCFPLHSDRCLILDYGIIERTRRCHDGEIQGTSQCSCLYSSMFLPLRP